MRWWSGLLSAYALKNIFNKDLQTTVAIPHDWQFLFGEARPQGILGADAARRWECVLQQTSRTKG
jgi:hypothetical protein